MDSFVEEEAIPKVRHDFRESFLFQEILMEGMLIKFYTHNCRMSNYSP